MQSSSERQKRYQVGLATRIDERKEEIQALRHDVSAAIAAQYVVAPLLEPYRNHSSNGTTAQKG
jgi:hypothetical protein